MNDLEIFLSVAPGLEPFLRQEVKNEGFQNPAVTQGGVTITGDWPEAWRANLILRGAAIA